MTTRRKKVDEKVDEVTQKEEPLNNNNGLSLRITNNGNRYWDMVNKIWLEEGDNFIEFEDFFKKERLTNNLIQINEIAGTNRFEWEG